MTLFSAGIGTVLIQSCLRPVGMTEIKYKPFRTVYEDNNLAKFRDSNDDVSIELRKAPVSKPIENLAIHYPALFPEGETVKPGDREEYVSIGDKMAYKVIFNTKYIRKRKRLDKKLGNDYNKAPDGWTESTLDDTLIGKKIPVLVGPVIPQKKILYVVPGPESVYYLLLTVEGTNHEDAIKGFDKFVREGIGYR